MYLEDRRRFENRFLASAERRKRVEFAKALARMISESAAVEEKVSPTVVSTAAVSSWRESLEAFVRGLNPVARFAMAAVVLLILVGGAWLITEMLRLRNQLIHLQAENQSRQNERQTLEQQVESERRRNIELKARLNQEKQQREQTDESLRQLTETQTAKNPPIQPIIASLILLPGISRGGGEKPSLVLSENVSVVRLRIGIDPEEQYEKFAVEVRTGAGRAVWSREILRVTDRGGTRTMGLTLPASALKPGEYELRLLGVAEGGGTEDVGFYYFDVTKK